MALFSISVKTPLVFLLFLVCLQSLGSSHPNPNPIKVCQFDQIYQFGDSFSDVGNLILESSDIPPPFTKLPYGESMFACYKNSTGGCSDGDLMIDYIAKVVGLPWSLPPYKSKGKDFGHGINFAVVGATTLPKEVLSSQGIFSQVTNSSLHVQIDWMMSYLDSAGLDYTHRAEKLRTALFMVGQIGASDYNYAIFQGKTIQELKRMVPQVVDAVMDATRKLINVGAETLVVSGIFPIGCFPIYKTYFGSNEIGAYNEYKCLEHLNEFAIYHNEQLQKAIQKLNDEEKPNAIVVYGDHFNAYKFMLKQLKAQGYETEAVCCGIGGKYNFDIKRLCGSGQNVPVCPLQFGFANGFVNWDGVHLTQKAYGMMAEWLVEADLLPNIQCDFDEFDHHRFG